MDIKIPAGIKSPTVVIIGGGTMTGDEKTNKNQEKRMDLLEKKLDQQYKNSTEGKGYAKDIGLIQRPFLKKLDKFVNQSRQSMTSHNDRLIEALKKTINQKVKVIKETSGKSDNTEIKSFMDKIDSLEEAIRKISMKSKTVNVNRQVSLDDSFDKFFARIEKAIKDARPRLSPSPS
jgi:hypothetical protein